MIKQLRMTLQRAEATLVQDALGAASLAVALLVLLHLPGL